MFSCGLARTRAPRARLSAYRTRLPISLWPMRCRTNNKVKYTHTQYQHTALSTLAAHASQTVISLLEEHSLAGYQRYLCPHHRRLPRRRRLPDVLLREQAKPDESHRPSLQAPRSGWMISPAGVAVACASRAGEAGRYSCTVFLPSTRLAPRNPPRAPPTRPSSPRSAGQGNRFRWGSSQRPGGTDGETPWLASTHHGSPTAAAAAVTGAAAAATTAVAASAGATTAATAGASGDAAVGTASQGTGVQSSPLSSPAQRLHAIEAADAAATATASLLAACSSSATFCS
jgi:hypothetical protein